jgi:hypothetical protein
MEMKMPIDKLAAATGAAVIALFLASPASALTMAECSVKYNAAKDAGTLDGKTWNQFRKAECGSDTSAADDTKAKKAKSSTADDSKPAKKAKKSTANASDDSDAKGLTMAECSAKYQAAKSGGTLNGMKWNDFRKAQCGAGASDDDTVPAADEASYTGDPEKPSIKAPRGVKFPSVVAKKYTDETPGKARMHTCLDQYYANKDADALNGLRWIQKGGGYYSLCNAKLKS